MNEYFFHGLFATLGVLAALVYALLFCLAVFFLVVLCRMVYSWLRNFF